jgi:PmbA protein
LEELLKQASKVSEEAEVFSLSHRETEALFEANRLKNVQTKESRGAALRIIKNGRLGFSATTKPDYSQLLPMALEMVPFGAKAKFQLPSTSVYPPVEVYDPDIGALSEEGMVELGQALIDGVRAYAPELVCEAGIARGITTVELFNSSGGRLSYEKSVFSVSLEGIFIRGTDMLFVGDGECSCHPISDVKSVVESVVRQLEWAKEIAPAPSGTLPVIFTPLGVASALIMPLMLAFNGKTVLRGASPLGDKKGERVFHPQLSIYDDATIPYRPQSRLCDDEGVPSRRIPLVDEGEVLNFLYDLQTAGQAGAESTGSASRALGSLPSPSVSALVIGEGEAEIEALLSYMREGLVVEQVMGASQGNILGGEFSGNVLLGYKVEKGRIVGRVKDTMLSGNVYEVLKEGIAIGRDSRWVGSSLLTPSIYCPKIAVAAKG